MNRQNKKHNFWHRAAGLTLAAALALSCLPVAALAQTPETADTGLGGAISSLVQVLGVDPNEPSALSDTTVSQPRQVAVTLTVNGETTEYTYGGDSSYGSSEYPFMDAWADANKLSSADTPATLTLRTVVHLPVYSSITPRPLVVEEGKNIVFNGGDYLLTINDWRSSNVTDPFYGIDSKGSFTMQSGTIEAKGCHNTCAFRGQGGSFTMEGGTICAKTYDNDPADAVSTMTGASFSDGCSVDIAGDAVLLADGASAEATNSFTGLEAINSTVKLHGNARVGATNSDSAGSGFSFKGISLVGSAVLKMYENAQVNVQGAPDWQVLGVITEGNDSSNKVTLDLSGNASVTATSDRTDSSAIGVTVARYTTAKLYGNAAVTAEGNYAYGMYLSCDPADTVEISGSAHVTAGSRAITRSAGETAGVYVLAGKLTVSETPVITGGSYGLQINLLEDTGTNRPVLSGGTYTGGVADISADGVDVKIAMSKLLPEDYAYYRGETASQENLITDSAILDAYSMKVHPVTVSACLHAWGHPAANNGNGTHHLTCSLCGHEEDQAHTFENGVCTACDVMDISGATVTAANTVYDGSAQRPNPIVTLNDEELTPEAFTVLRYENNTNAGTGKIFITGRGDYWGEASGTFVIEKAPITDVSATVNDVKTPQALNPAQGDVADGESYTAAIVWAPADANFGFNTAYTATLTLTPDANHKFGETITGADGWNAATSEGVLTLTKIFAKTRMEKLTAVTAPQDVTLTQHLATGPEVCRLLEAQTPTVTVTLEHNGTVELPVEWHYHSGYNSAPGEVNTFTWSVPDSAVNDLYDKNGVALTGTIRVTNPAPLPVTITGEDQTLVYDGGPVDLAALFAIDENAGAARYTVTPGTGAYTPQSPTAIAVTRAGTFTVTVETASRYPYDTGRHTLTLTVEKAAGEGAVTLAGWTYGEAANAPQPVSAANGTDGVSYLYESADGAGYRSETAPKNAGRYKLTASFAETDLYHAATAETELVIAPKQITVTADDKSKPYGDSDPALTWTADGLLAGDTLPGIAVSRQAGEDPGVYTVTASQQGSANPNYGVNFVAGRLTVERRDITGATVTLGEALTANGQPQTQTVAGVTVKNNDGKELPVTYTVTGNRGTAPGTYTMTITATGSFTGTITKEFVIAPAPVPTATAKPIATPVPTATAKPSGTPVPTEAPTPDNTQAPDSAVDTSVTAVPPATAAPTAPTTGDAARPWLWCALLLLSGGGLAALFLLRKKDR